MRVRLYTNGAECPVGNFVGRYLGNVCAAIGASLKAPRPARILSFELEGDRVLFRVDEDRVSLDQGRGFAVTIVRDTLRGMVRHLKNVDPEGSVRIEVVCEGEPQSAH